VQGLTVDLELRGRRVGHEEPYLKASVDANQLTGLIPAVCPTLSPLARPGVLEGSRRSGIVVEAVEGTDKALAVNALDPEVLQVVHTHDHVDVPASVTSVPTHGPDAPMARVPSDWRDPQQRPWRKVPRAALDVEAALAAGGFPRDIAHQAPAQQPLRHPVFGRSNVCHIGILRHGVGTSKTLIR
jgi:hypothetical protein